MVLIFHIFIPYRGAAIEWLLVADHKLVAHLSGLVNTLGVGEDQGGGAVWLKQE